MDLSFGSEYEGFRDEVKTFLKNNQDKVPKGTARAQDAEAAQQLLDWQKLLIENGYTCRTIPKEYGGYGAEPNIIESRIIPFFPSLNYPFLFIKILELPPLTRA